MNTKKSARGTDVAKEMMAFGYPTEIHRPFCMELKVLNEPA